jgi:acyl carrier protein
MTSEQVYAQLTDVFQIVFDDPSIQLRPDMTAADIVEWDSVSHLDLVLAVETKFKLRLNLAEVESLQTVGDFVDLLQKRLTG